MTVTILAFIYVPLNLATSIYGMNIKQLNGNGQTVWVFVVTAMIALIIIAGTWYLAEGVNTYRNWHRKRTEHNSMHFIGSVVQRPSFSIAERVAMIVWLRNHGYVGWMRRTGAWWKILCNSSRPMMVAFKFGGHGQQTSTGELVSRYSSSQLADVDLEKCIGL